MIHSCVMLCPFSRLCILFHLFLHRGGGWCFIGCSHRLPCLRLREVNSGYGFWVMNILLQNTHVLYVCVYKYYIYMYCYVICGVNSVTRIPDIIQLVGDTIPWYVAYDWYVLFLNSALSPSLGLQPRSLHLQSPCGEVRRLGSPRSPRMP